MWKRLAILAGVAACTRAVPAVSLVTAGETSNYRITGRYAETERLCRNFAIRYEGVRCDVIGKTTEDRPIVALHVTRAPASAPTIYMQGGIHAGEIEGKDAGFWFLRDLLDGKTAPGALAAVNLIFVPVVNPDGHERFGPNHRANQRGPAEMGFRTTASRLNMNRDFVKADAPETQAVLGVIARWDPVLFLDLHATDGAKFEHDIAIIPTPYAPRGDRLEETAGALGTAIAAKLTAWGHLPVLFYPSFVADDDPTSGFEHGEAPPRFGHYYMAARGRMGILVETHSWRTYRERVQSTYHTLRAVFELAATEAATWRAVSDEATRADERLGGTSVALWWEATKQSRPIQFRGYAYEKRESELSEQPWIVYDETKPEVWTVPFYDQLAPAVTITLPARGYVVEGGFAPVVRELLHRHHLTYEMIEGTHELDVFRATKVTPGAQSYEGRTRVALEGAWTKERRTLDRGAIFVPIAQPGARLIAHMFEPALPDALVNWGMFSTAFERKEYMEGYVAEQIARELLAADPTLRAKFDAAVAADPELAKDGARRLDWFYQRSPAWDERVNLVPVYRR